MKIFLMAAHSNKKKLIAARVSFPLSLKKDFAILSTLKIQRRNGPGENDHIKY